MRINKGLRDKPRSMLPSDEYRDNYDRIFGKGSKTQEASPDDRRNENAGEQTEKHSHETKI